MLTCFDDQLDALHVVGRSDRMFVSCNPDEILQSYTVFSRILVGAAAHDLELRRERFYDITAVPEIEHA